MLKNIPVRLVNVLSCLAVVILLALASYLQRVKGLEPCPLCMVQRLIFIGMAILFFIGIFLPARPRVVKVHYSFVLLLVSLGLVAVFRQLWLIHFSAEQVPSCGADFYYMVQHLPWGQVLSEIVQGQGDCARDVWKVAGIGLPAWSALAFLFFWVVAIWQLCRKV